MKTPNGMPRILEDELFERVQHILDRNKKAPARTRGRDEYLLTTKLFCGYRRGDDDRLRRHREVRQGISLLCLQ